MGRMDYLRISAVNWCLQFENVDGSYYDYKAHMYSTSKETHEKIEQELLSKGWRKINVQSSDYFVYEKERHVLVINKIWDVK